MHDFHSHQIKIHNKNQFNAFIVCGSCSVQRKLLCKYTLHSYSETRFISQRHWRHWRHSQSTCNKLVLFAKNVPTQTCASSLERTFTRLTCRFKIASSNCHHSFNGAKKRENWNQIRNVKKMNKNVMGIYHVHHFISFWRVTMFWIIYWNTSKW